MSDLLTDLFAKIEKYIINQAQTYKGLPNEVLSPISDIENQHIAKRLLILQNEQKIEFSLDEILQKITHIDVSDYEELIESNEPQLIEESSEQEIANDSEFTVSSELSDLPNVEIKPKSSNLKVETDSDSELENELILETEDIVQIEEAIESLKSETATDASEDEFITIPDYTISIEEKAAITSETSVEDSPIEEESFTDSENEDIDLSSIESEFSLEDNSDSSQENESIISEEIKSEVVKEEPVEESLQFDLFGPIPSKPSSKTTYQHRNHSELQVYLTLNHLKKSQARNII